MEPMILGLLGGMAAIFGGIIFVLSRGAPSRNAKQSDYPNVYQPAQSYGGSKRRGSKMNKSRKRR